MFPPMMSPIIPIIPLLMLRHRVRGGGSSGPPPKGFAKWCFAIIAIWFLLALPGIGWQSADECATLTNLDVRYVIGSSIGPWIMLGPIISVTIYFETGFAEHGWCITVKSCEAIREASWGK